MRHSRSPVGSCPSGTQAWDKALRPLTELRVLEKVTVTEATAEDMEKVRPRLKNVHISVLVSPIMTMAKMERARLI